MSSSHTNSHSQDYVNATLDAYMEEFGWHIVANQIKKLNQSENTTALSKASSYVKFQDQVCTINQSRKRTPNWFVTVNPRGDVCFKDFHETVCKVLNNPEIEDPFWCYEIRDSDSPNRGLHAHILFHCETKNRNFAYRKIKIPFLDKMCGNTKHIDIKYVPESEIENVKSYIRKDKISRTKKKANDETIQWRIQNNLKPIYEGADLLV